MSNAVNNTGQVKQVGLFNFETNSSSIQVAFGLLQLRQSQLCQNSANTYLDIIKQGQEKQKKCADMIAKARSQQNAGNGAWATDMKDYFSKNNIPVASNKGDKTSPAFTKDEWEYNIKSLLNYQETLGTTTQTDMVLLQDLMGQYNTYLQGANKAIQDSGDTLKSILAR